MNNKDFSLSEACQKLGLQIPELYLPSEQTDISVWPVIACDQYTSQPEYWQETERITAGKASSLSLILPEIYLENPGNISIDRRINKINSNMKEYINSGILELQEKGCILIDRSTPLHPSRKGLIISVDLEQYDYKPGNKELIRATEGTVLERIPPRQAIRRDALLELPHVQLLIDDPDFSVIEPLCSDIASSEPLYDLDLMQGGGHLKGWFIPENHASLKKAILAMLNLKTLEQDNLLFAVGDGNHSLATAQAHWHEIRNNVSPDHPARYALVEIINIHDKGLDFEPIHRAVFDTEASEFVKMAQQWANNLKQDLEKSKASETDKSSYSIHELPLYTANDDIIIDLPIAENTLVTAIVQNMLDDLLAELKKKGQNARIDYIHGVDSVRELADKGAIGFILPPFAKDAFFATISKDGILPRKTFSMGEAFEKRYYFECRSIK